MNILDYLDWRGDLSFAASPFNEVDALICAWLIYYRFEELGADNVEGLTFMELAALHEHARGPFQKVHVSTTILPNVTAAWLLYRASLAPRYASARLLRFREVTDDAAGVQFAAATFDLEGGPRVLAYRGTDSTLAGWKEDCYLSFSEAVPAQTLAASYLAEMDNGRELAICGHSKGGNLAMYAALYGPEEAVSRIVQVYNFDGPGFSFELSDVARYARMRDRIVTIVPESSIVGMLLNHEEDYRIVRSRMASILQHDAMFWQVLGARFVYTDKRNASSVVIDNKLGQWIDGMSFQERREFVDAVFAILESTGAKQLNELPEKIAQNGFKILAAPSALTPEQKAVVTRLLLNLVKAGNAKLYDAAMSGDGTDNESLRGILDGTSRLAEAVDRGLDAIAARFRRAKEQPKLPAEPPAETTPETSEEPIREEP